MVADRQNGNNSKNTSKEMSLEKHVVLCDCHSPEHQFIIIKDTKDNDVWLEIHLCPTPGFFWRLWIGLKYAFGYRSRYGDFDSILISLEDQAKIVQLLQTSEQ
jgi:hypothetical protein